MEVVNESDRASFTRKLEDSDERIAAMDAAGIDLFVLSQTSPGVQAEKDSAVAVQRARAANDYMKALVDEHPDRYRAFAHLAMQDVTAAADELQRCVNDLGFLGALINGSTNGIYSTTPATSRSGSASRSWACRSTSIRPIPSSSRTSSTAWRIDSRYEVTNSADKPPLQKAPSEYFRSNLIITTTGVCQDSSLQCAIAMMGEDRVLFSVDYPYEDATQAAQWIETTPLTDEQREKICHGNAERVLGLT
ncbi:MAG: amidohydrolase family protein [Thermoanaerobaculia bacterium]